MRSATNGNGLVVSDVNTGHNVVAVYSDYNLYADLTPGSNAIIAAVDNSGASGGGTNCNTLSQVQAAVQGSVANGKMFGLDGTTASAESHSLYTTSPAIFLNSGNHDYRLAAGCLAIGAGRDVGLYRDYLGTPIPAANHSGVDVGAYQFSDLQTNLFPTNIDAGVTINGVTGAAVLTATSAQAALTAALNIGGHAPGAAGGLALVGSNMGSVSSVTGPVGSVTSAVNVGGYAAGQDPLTLLTGGTVTIGVDSSHRITSILSVGSGAGQVNVSGGKVPATLNWADIQGTLP